MTPHSLVVPVALKQCATIYVAVELSMSSWVIGVVDPRNGKISRHQIPCSDIERLMELIVRARKATDCERVVLCYEAGRDGFWISRLLQQRGLEVLVLDPASLPVDRRRRRAKTDGLDVEMLLRAVMAHERGEPRACSIVRVPSVEEEDVRRLPRERDRLQSACTAHSNRIKGLLAVQGIYHVSPLRADFLDRLKERRTGDDRPLPQQLGREVEREVERLRLIQREQGISKAGNGRVRTSMIELVWLWLKWQPDSALSKWFRQRVGDLKGRMRKITAVAMARKLLIALWQHVTAGVEIEGAVLSS